MDLGHWRLADGLTWDATAIGFIYVIVNKNCRRAYIGRKLLSRAATRGPLKGRVNKRRYRKESDWKNYCSSCVDLQVDIDLQGEDSFDFVIVGFCHSTFAMTYLEAAMQVRFGVLFGRFYNRNIMMRVKHPPRGYHPEDERIIENRIEQVL